MAKNKNTKTTNPRCSSISSKNNKETEGVDKGLEHSKYVYDLVNGWIENADNKVNVSCGMFSVTFGVVSFLADHYLNMIDKPVANEFWYCIYKGSFVISFVIMLVAVLFYARAITPNLKSSGEKRIPKKYPIYYGDISSIRLSEYRERIINGDDNDFNEELIREIHMNSQICTRKMKQYKLGIILSTIAIVFAVLSLISHFLMYK